MGLLVEGEKGAACDVDPVGDMTTAESAVTVPWFSLVIAPHLSCLKIEKGAFLPNLSIADLIPIYRRVIITLNALFNI